MAHASINNTSMNRSLNIKKILYRNRKNLWPTPFFVSRTNNELTLRKNRIECLSMAFTLTSPPSLLLLMVLLYKQIMCVCAPHELCTRIHILVSVN